MNTNVTSAFFSSKDVHFTLRFPGIIKKTFSLKENIFSGFTLENEDSYYLHCKTFIPVTYMTISFTSALRAGAPFDRCFVNNIFAS